jgi:hypothetical protein
MFKVYSHISSLTQELYYLNSLNPINLKKKEICLVSPARARRNRSILLQSNSILPFFPPPCTHPTLFLSSLSSRLSPAAPFLPQSVPDLLLRRHFVPPHLASAYTFFSTRPIRAQTTRLRLRHLNKPCCGRFLA